MKLKLNEEQLNNLSKNASKHFKKIMAGLTLTAVLLGTTGCGRDYEENADPFQIISDSSEETYLDDIDALQLADSSEETSNIFSKIETVNNYLDLSKKLEDIDEYDITNLSQEVKDKVAGYTGDQMNDLIDQYNSLNDSGADEIKKDRIGCELAYLNELCDTWFAENALAYSESILKTTVKATACSALELEPYEYSNFSISSQRGKNDDTGEAATITYSDPETGIEYDYGVKDSVLLDAIGAIYYIQDSQAYYDVDDMKSICKSAIKYLNYCVLSGAEIKDESISSERKYSDVEAIMKKK